MKRKRQPSASSGSLWRDTCADAAGLSFRQVSIWEQANDWPSPLLRSAFFDRDDIPKQYQGLEAPGRPDPRVALSEKPAVVRAFERAHAEWEAQAEKWREDRLRWLRRAAKGEK